MLGVRPESIHIDSKTGTPAKVIVVEPTGAETHLSVKMAGHELVCVLRERVSLRPDETVLLSLGKSIVHFFDPASGDRIYG